MSTPPTSPVRIRKLDSSAADFQPVLAALLAFEASTDDAIETAVARILADVKARGNAAVLEYTNRFDRLPDGGAVSVDTLDLPQAELQAALDALPAAQRAALQAVSYTHLTLPTKA